MQPQSIDQWLVLISESKRLSFDLKCMEVGIKKTSDAKIKKIHKLLLKSRERTDRRWRKLWQYRTRHQLLPRLPE